MRKNWLTKYKDIYEAQCIMEKFAQEQNTHILGLFEVVVDIPKKRMDICVSSWVVALTQHFKTLYGENQGDFVARHVISSCIIRNEIVH